MTHLRIWLLMLFASLAMALTATEPALHLSSISHKDGLSNSAVISIYQDSTGLMWFGTYDGLNCYDGNRIETFKADFSANTTLDNNIIANIQYAGDNQIWVCSYSGTSRFHLSNRKVTDTFGFDKEFRLISNPAGDTWAYDLSHIYYFNRRYNKFVAACENPGFELDETAAHVGADGEVTLISSGRSDTWSCAVSSFTDDTLTTQVVHNEQKFHKLPITFATSHHDLCCFTDTRNDLYLYDILHKNKIFITNVGSLIDHYGQISQIIPFFGDILISFSSHGILRLKMSERYAGKELVRNLRVFCLYADPHQGVLWVGTDGQGVIKVTRQDLWANNILLNDLSLNLNGQIRGISTDPYGTLWVGTKGDGLLSIPNYEHGIDPQKIKIYTPEFTKSLPEYERGSKFYPVFSMKQSRYSNGFWVGMQDTLLYFFSQNDKSLHPIYGALGKKQTEVHAVYEQGDSILWIATVGTGFHKVKIRRHSNSFEVLQHKQFHFFNNQHELLEFSSICAQGDSVLWLGSRCKGLVRFNIPRHEYQVVSLSALLKRSVDDVLCMRPYKDSILYVGTTTGLVALDWQNRRLSPTYIGRENGLFNDMIHGIVCDRTGLLWLGTNKGLIKFNPDNNESYTYYYSRGVEIGEFSDDSYHECPHSGNLFLGGVNGLVYFNRKEADHSDYYPNILLRSISFGQDRHYWKEFYDNDKQHMVISSRQNDFTLEFVAPEYLVTDLEYSYQLEGYDKDWSVFSKRNEAFYSSIPVGKYEFKVRYKKDVLDSGYKEFSIPLEIITPWYLSTLAWCIYILVGILLFIVFLRLYRAYLYKQFALQQKQQQAEQEQQQQAQQVALQTDDQPATDNSIRQQLIEKLGQEVTPLLTCQTDEQAQFLLDVIAYIEAHLDMEDLNIAFLAEHWNVSVRQFYRIFKSSITLSPLDLVKQLRMAKAAHLLKHSEMSIQEIIDTIGISSRSHFYKEFSQYFGTTPGNMREEHSAKADKEAE